MPTAGLWMLAGLGVLLVATGLPAWIVVIGVALVFSVAGVALGALSLPLLTAIPARLIGLLESDLLQALPLYALMGALLNHLPLAEIVFRAGNRALRSTGAGGPLAGFGLGVLLAPMNGSVGASVATLTRVVQPRLDAEGMPAERSAALVCMVSTLGVVIPPSLVLILLGDAMMRAHTEALNLTGESVRVINTQDVFAGALIPAGLLLLLAVALTWWLARREPHALPSPPRSPTMREWMVAVLTVSFVVALLGGVALGYLYAVEAAAAGGVALFVFGLATRTLTRDVLREVLRDTMAITGALFALLVAATVFTLVLRGYGTDRWIGATLSHLAWGEYPTLLLVLLVLALCALVLDAFEMIFVVVPVVMPPLLTLVHNVTWVAVLTLLILQASFLVPPFGYAVLMVRNRSRRPLSSNLLARALLPYLAAQLVVLALVLAEPRLAWQRNPIELAPSGVMPRSEEEGNEMLQKQLDQQLPPGPPDAEPALPPPGAQPPR
jgi:tripartite ATP-independent transporter DctM subunit